MCGTGVRASFESYLSSNTNHYFSKGNDWFGILDDGFFKLGKHSMGLGQQIAKLTGNAEAEEKCQKVFSGFDAAGDGIGAVRFVFPLHKLFTGQIFLQSSDKGLRKVLTVSGGKPYRIPKEDLELCWEKRPDGTWFNKRSEQKSLDGKYIEDDISGEYIRREWMDIAMDILVLIARLLSPIKWLHSLKVIDLGKHAKWIGGVTAALWGMVVSIGLIQSIRNLIDEVDLASMQKRLWEAFQGFIDLLALPFDFGIGSAHPVIASVGAGINIISASSLLVKEAIYYS